MIFLAVAGPTPGSASSCAWVAVLRSTGPAGGAALPEAATAGAAASRASRSTGTQDSRPALLNLKDIVISPFPGHEKRIRTHSNGSIIALPGLLRPPSLCLVWNTFRSSGRVEVQNEAIPTVQTRPRPPGRPRHRAGVVCIRGGPAGGPQGLRDGARRLSRRHVDARRHLPAA